MTLDGDLLETGVAAVLALMRGDEEGVSVLIHGEPNLHRLALMLVVHLKTALEVISDFTRESPIEVAALLLAAIIRRNA